MRWLLVVRRDRLTDALRGRRELARSLFHGFYRTFARRMLEVDEEGGRKYKKKRSVVVELELGSNGTLELERTWNGREPTLERNSGRHARAFARRVGSKANV